MIRRLIANGCDLTIQYQSNVSAYDMLLDYYQLVDVDTRPLLSLDGLSLDVKGDIDMAHVRQDVSDWTDWDGHYQALN